MPGITGIIGRPPRESRRQTVDAMLGCMHRAPASVSESISNNDLGLTVGWICRPGTFADCLPIWNETRDIFVIFAGEDFRDAHALKLLKSAGHDFDPDTASYLVHAYEEQGEAFLADLNGCFSGLVVDLRRQQVLLFNDRYGANRVYWHEDAEGFYFSSEAKAILKVLPDLRRVDPRSLGEFISCGAVLQDRTLFPGIKLLPGGSVLTFRKDQTVQRQKYFHKETWENQPLLRNGEYYAKLRDTWSRILPRYFAGREKIGLSLTGGVDSRMILAWAPRPPGELPCYTFGGPYRDCADVTLSRRIAEICRQPHETIPVGKEFFAQFPNLARDSVWISDGSMDVTGAIDLYVQKAARRLAPVRLSGVNGGEILRRLVWFKPEGWCAGLLAPEIKAGIDASAKTLAAELNCHPLSFVAFKQSAWHMASKFSLERSQVTFRTPYFDNDLVALAYQTPPELVPVNDSSLRLIADGNPALGRVGTDRALLVNSVPGLTRARHYLREFTFKAEYAYDYGMPQWLATADHALSPLRLERLFLGRHKFHHFRVYYRDALAGFVKDLLLDPRAKKRSWYLADKVEDMVLAHTSGRRNHTVDLHKLLTLELIARLFVDPS